MAGMQQIVSLIRDHMHAEAEAGYPLLRRIPSSRATANFDYLASISPSEQEELLAARARFFALAITPTPAAQQEVRQLMDSDPALSRYRKEMLQGQFPAGLRYQSIRMAQAMLKDPQSVAMMLQARLRLDYIPRDDAPVPLVNNTDVTKLHPAKAPQLKKLVKSLMQHLLGAKEEKKPGGTMAYGGLLDGTPLKVRFTYTNQVQMIYGVSIPDIERKVVLTGTAYENYFGAGAGWDYLTEENAEASIGLLPELLHRLVELRNEIKRLI
jgi:hypothetical protein